MVAGGLRREEEDQRRDRMQVSSRWERRVFQRKEGRDRDFLDFRKYSAFGFLGLGIRRKDRVYDFSFTKQKVWVPDLQIPGLKAKQTSPNC